MGKIKIRLKEKNIVHHIYRDGVYMGNIVLTERASLTEEEYKRFN